MAIYKIDEILNCISSMKKDGFEYVDILVLEAEDDMPETLSIDAIVSKNESENDTIDAVTLPNDYCLERYL